MMLSKKKWFLFSLLTLCGGTIYKLPSLKDAFYIPMQEFFHLTHGEIGNAMSVNSFVATIGFFLSIYFADKLPRRLAMAGSLIATGLLGLYLSTFPSYWGILVVWALFGITCDMMNWPVLLKSVSMLGTSDQQGRLFGFFETGRGIVDTVVAFSALGVFSLVSYYGGQALGFKASIWFYSGVAIFVGILIFFVMKNTHDTSQKELEEEEKKPKDSILLVLKNKIVWMIAFNVFFVYAVYCGLTFFIPFLKNIYMLPVAMVGAYGIINQYCLKMVGGPIGGLLSDKVFHSPVKYLLCTFTLCTILLVVLILLPHESMPIYLGMVSTLGFGAIVFSQRAIFFAPFGEAKIEQKHTGSAMALGSFVGYAPAMFCFSLYGNILDHFPGLQGYQIVFAVMACFSMAGAILSVALVHTMKKQQSTGQEP